MYDVVWWRGVGAYPQESGIVSSHETLVGALNGILQAPEYNWPHTGLPSVRVGEHVRVIDRPIVGDEKTWKFHMIVAHYPTPKDNGFYLDLVGEDEVFAFSHQYADSAEEAEAMALRMDEIASRVIARGWEEGAFVGVGIEGSRVQEEPDKDEEDYSEDYTEPFYLEEDDNA